jgi:hypothetical protein
MELGLMLTGDQSTERRADLTERRAELTGWMAALMEERWLNDVVRDAKKVA